MRTKYFRPARIERSYPRLVRIRTSDGRGARDADVVCRRNSITTFIEACEKIEVSTGLNYE
jgi:hypothetical protein